MTETPNYKDLLFRIITARILYGDDKPSQVIAKIDEITPTMVVAMELLEWSETSDEFED